MITDIKEQMSWPPMDLERYKMQEHNAWFSGEAELLANFYFDNDLKNYLNLNYGTRNSNRFWARQIKNSSEYFIHVPIANDISETSSSFLFGETPLIRFNSDSEGMKDAQSTLDKMLTESGFYQKLVEGAEVASAIGGVYLKIAWDSELSEYPIPVIAQCEQAFPTFKFGKLVKVKLVYEVEYDGSTCYRLVETIEKGKITNELYQGSADNLGNKVSLSECEATKDLDETVDTAGVMTCFFVPNMLPNKLNRMSPMGRSDYQGQETLMDALDEVFSAWMIDVQIARGKIHVPSGYVKSMDNGKTKFNIDTMMYEELDIDPTAMSKPIEATQFEIRAEQFEKTCLNLLDRIITSAGYSPQSFGLNIAGRAESGTALNVRERKSFSTTSKKQSYWEPVIKEAVTSMCVLYNTFLGGKLTNDLEVNVEFMDSVSNNLTEVSNSVKTLSDAKALSTDTKIRMVHPEWTDTQVQEEVERILNDDQAGMPMDNPEDLIQMQFGKNNQGEGNNVTDDKSEGSKDMIEE
jgi:A118 family predicted phage portal protein